eukprot:948042-Amorphochlora_amoeboformis.AAC.2
MRGRGHDREYGVDDHEKPSSAFLEIHGECRSEASEPPPSREKLIAHIYFRVFPGWSKANFAPDPTSHPPCLRYTVPTHKYGIYRPPCLPSPRCAP